ncbi:MAG: hypothetical protein M3R15_32555 [Acidobacteriota bacterium]|nr:hypothetical protein [Acidobacteriota bacterium]
MLNRIFGNSGQSVIRGGYSFAFVREGLANVISVSRTLAANQLHVLKIFNERIRFQSDGLESAIYVAR